MYSVFTYSRAVSPEKIVPTLLRVDGSVTLFKLEQPLKKLPPRDVTPSGIVISSRDVQALNISVGRAVNFTSS